MNTNTEKREVTPQWDTANKRNLGTHSVTVVPFTVESVKAACEKRAADIAEILNAQCSIKFLGPCIVKRVTESIHLPQGTRLDANGEEEEFDEKLEAFRERTLGEAREAVKAVVTETFSFPALFEEWASAERTTKGKKVLANYDGIIANVEARWGETTPEKRANLLAKLSITLGTDATATDVVKAIEGAYKPATVVTVDAML